jgi:hypothetical protein
MRYPRSWPRFLALGLLALSLTATSGCMGFLHPVDTTHAQIEETCKTLPKCCRDHVYVFLLNGLDPFNYGNLTGVRDYLQGLGLTRTYYGQCYHAWQFENEIRRVHEHDADAHFVLIGFSVGVNVVDSMARTVQKDGIYIDMLVFLSGNHPVWPMPKDQPANVGRVINLLADGCMGKRGERAYAENYRLQKTLHFGSPTHPTTLEMLARELTCLVQMVTVTEPMPGPGPQSSDEAPTPRPVRIPISTQKDEWDFLKPVARLSKPPSYFKEETFTFKPAADNP